MRNIIKARKLSRAQCIALQHGQYIRIDGTGYFRVRNIIKLNKQIRVYSINDDIYEFEEALIDKACYYCDCLYKTSKSFRADYSNGIEESSILNVLNSFGCLTDTNN